MDDLHIDYIDADETWKQRIAEEWGEIVAQHMHIVNGFSILALCDGKPVGLTSSVAYGNSVGKILAFAYVKPEAAVPGTEVEVMLLGEPRNGRVLAQPAYDPQNIRPRADAQWTASG